MVDEKQTNEAEKPIVPAANTPTGDKPETASLIERADRIAERVEKANQKAEELLIRQEAIAARMMLSGRAEAGQTPKTSEEMRKEQVQKEVAEIMKKFR
jgi:hypothetical protein